MVESVPLPLMNGNGLMPVHIYETQNTLAGVSSTLFGVSTIPGVSTISGLWTGLDCRLDSGLDHGLSFLGSDQLMSQ